MNLEARISVSRSQGTWAPYILFCNPTISNTIGKKPKIRQETLKQENYQKRTIEFRVVTTMSALVARVRAGY